MRKDILIRLVDTSRLPMRDQISIMKKTDYFVGIHGAGFFYLFFYLRILLFMNYYLGVI